jgi:hypothetical protein
MLITEYNLGRIAKAISKNNMNAIFEYLGRFESQTNPQIRGYDKNT